jgi:hypothetical protein
MAITKRHVHPQADTVKAAMERASAFQSVRAVSCYAASFPAPDRAAGRDIGMVGTERASWISDAASGPPAFFSPARPNIQGGHSFGHTVKHPTELVVDQ